MGDSRAAGLGRVLEHDHVEAVYGEMDRCHKAVVSASDDENPTHYLQPTPTPSRSRTGRRATQPTARGSYLQIKS